MQLCFPSDAVVVVAGVPGAGKTTLIRRAADRDFVRVLDTDDRRRAGARRLLYAGHYARIAAAVAGRRPVVIHSRGTHRAARRAIALLAALRGRPAHLVMLHAERPEAEAGQRARGRTVAAAEMGRQVARWRRLMARRPEREGWDSVTVLDRRRAAGVEAFAFVPAGERALAPATFEHHLLTARLHRAAGRVDPRLDRLEQRLRVGRDRHAAAGTRVGACMKRPVKSYAGRHPHRGIS